MTSAEAIPCRATPRCAPAIGYVAAPPAVPSSTRRMPNSDDCIGILHFERTARRASSSWRVRPSSAQANWPAKDRGSPAGHVRIAPRGSAVPDVFDALAADIPFRLADAELVLDRPVASALVAVLHVIDDPEVNRELRDAPSNPDASMRCQSPGGFWAARLWLHRSRPRDRRG